MIDIMLCWRALSWLFKFLSNKGFLFQTIHSCNVSTACISIEMKKLMGKYRYISTQQTSVSISVKLFQSIYRRGGSVWLCTQTLAIHDRDAVVWGSLCGSGALILKGRISLCYKFRKDWKCAAQNFAERKLKKKFMALTHIKNI